MIRTLVACAALLGMAPSLACAAADDPYAPLKLYEGDWLVTSTGSAKPMRVENHCARTGLFFACEQVVDGKSAALVVFLPEGRSAAGESYRTQALRADAATPGPWYTLTIDGERWVYAQGTQSGGRAVHKRTVNQFSGPDHISFEVQSSTDGRNWTTTMNGEERRTQ
ncbi:MAG TPA: hypothetical protein VII63_03695 [Caulobacteraceae bacterium]